VSAGATATERNTAGVAVIGAGPAGLAAAAAVQHAGASALVFEQEAQIGRTWRRGYDRLRLNTSRMTSRLAGTPFPRGAGMFPSRDAFIEYLESFAQRHRLDLRPDTRVLRLDPDGAGWRLRTAGGDVRAGAVVVATGYANVPFVPHWEGRAGTSIEVMHASDYRNPARLRGRDVLVVGAGSTGMEIAHDLATGGARRVRLAVRTPPNVVLRAVGGLPGDVFGVGLLALPPVISDRLARRMRRMVLGDLSAHGLPDPAEGPFARLRRLGVGAAVVDRDVLDAIVDGAVEIVSGVDDLAGPAVRLSDGSRIHPDAVIAATGYRTGLEPLVGHLGVLDARGVPRIVGGREAAPGLHFVGFVPAPGQIRRISQEARRAARGIVRRSRAASPA
jgi:cation diffusion facilitator CzcD-associated flavoprotein CzcO